MENCYFLVCYVTLAYSYVLYLIYIFVIFKWLCTLTVFPIENLITSIYTYFYFVTSSFISRQ